MPEPPTTTIDSLAIHVGSGATPTGGSEVYRSEGILFIRSQNVRNGGLALDDIAFIDSKTHAAMRRSRILPHDVLLNITGASIGRCCTVPADMGEANVNQHVCAIRLPEARREDAAYLAAVLESHIGQSQIDRLNAGGNREGLNYQQIRRFVIPWPNTDQRKRVADILDAADAAIRQTEVVIAKLRQMKAGLLHDLLTRGLDEQGRLRDPDAHPEQFKDSPLGRIPKEWDPIRLEHVGQWRSGGTPSKENPRFWGGSIPWVSAKDMKSFWLTDSQDHLSALALAAGARLTPANSVLLLVRGMTLANTLPVCLTGREMAFNQDVRAVVPHGTVTARYLGYWLVAHESRVLGIATEATHGTKRIDVADLHNLLIPLPSRDEQDRISEVVEAHDSTARAEEACRDKLKLQKWGLMHDLLTGRVRI